MSITERRRERVREALAARIGSVVVVAEAVQRRHNVSAILRSTEAFGLHEVHLVTGVFRPSRGASRGSERWLELHRHAEVEEAVAGLKARGFRLYVADLDQDAVPPERVPVDQPVALLFGSELRGVSEAARALADGFVTVPMRGLTESLNVSVASACTLQVVAERRRAVVGGGDLSPERQAAFYADWLVREEAGEEGMRARVGGPQAAIDRA
jgi:tRNA (guanosine-2'-O-)-methyltransferase